ncbi:DegV family protein [Paenibacillus sp. GCM10027626]|uniref:DegV family protein n=1 Tax=Paenibacillus sp. GCM10027626 TaxID=3273411 RepID=UPI00362D5E7C
MRKVRIVADSTSDIPQEIRERLGIEMIPLKVIFGEQSYLDAVTISQEQFYDKLTKEPALPTTSQPSPVDFMEMYERILDAEPGVAIISIHLSAALSGTYQSAILGSSMLERECDVSVYDSKSASYGIGMLVVKAAEMAEAGCTKDEILQAIEQLKADMKLYFLVDTLEYLQKGGRIGKAAALFGSILNIKPILSLDSEGVVTAIEKVRGQKKAMGRILDLLTSEFGNDPVEMTLAWTTSSEAALELGRLASERLDVRSTSHTHIGAVIGTHVGPGTSAIFVHRVKG